MKNFLSIFMLIGVITIIEIIIPIGIEFWTGWPSWATLCIMSVIICCYALWYRWLLKKRLMRIRIDIRGTIQRLKTRESTDDICAVDDAIDFLLGIDDSYSSEVPFLIESLDKEEDGETLNFILCVLKEMSNTLNEKIISILGLKLVLISDRIISGKNEYDDTRCYIREYLVSQGTPYKETIKQVLQKVLSSKISSYIRADASVILRKLGITTKDNVMVGSLKAIGIGIGSMGADRQD